MRSPQVPLTPRGGRERQGRGKRGRERMGGKRGVEGERKDVVLKVRLTRGSYERLREAAEERGVSIAEFVRDVVLREAGDSERCRQCKERLRLEAVTVLGWELNRIGVALNRIARWVKERGLGVEGARVMYFLSCIERELKRVSNVGEVDRQEQGCRVSD